MTADWNAGVYHQLSAPQQAWGQRVLARLPLDGDERVLDLGCAAHFGRWTDPWMFADLNETIARLDAAGFRDVHADLEPAPTTMKDRATFVDFIACVCVRHHVDTLPVPLRRPFVESLA